MRPVTPEFLEALTRPHKLAMRADLLFDRQRQDTPLNLIGGTATLDRTAEIRGQCDITIGAIGLIPTGPFDPITPFGAELQLWRGIQFPSGDELVSTGIFGIQEIEVDDSGGSIRIAGLDRAQLVKDADFEKTYIVGAGSNYGAAIRALIDDGVPGLEYRFASTEELTPLLVFDADTEGGRWAAALKMATDLGCDLYFDGDGRCVLEPVPDPRTDPVARLSDGPGGVVVSAGKQWSRVPAYNAVVAYSSNPSDTGPPARAVVRDEDVTSPTYYFGPFGKKPRRYASPLTTSTGLENAAAAMLRAGLGVSQTLNLEHVPNPALEPGDIVEVARTSLGVDEVDVLDSVVIPFDESSTMTAGVRARQIA